MKLTFLGTGCSAPSKERNLSSVCLNFDGENFLFDCGEGTQRQIMSAKISYQKINYIFLTHLHADHFLGLPGLIATMSMHQRINPLTVFGPRGTSKRLKQLIEFANINPCYPVKAIEISREGKILEREKFFVSAVKVKHDIPCFGFIFKEKDSLGKFLREKALKLGIPEGPLWGKLQAGKTIKWNGKIFKPEQVLNVREKKIGKKVSFIMDSLPWNHYFKAIEESDALIHESAFLEELSNRARQTFHCTSKQAAMIAKKTHCKKLFLTHFSNRWKQSDKFENEARMVFAESIATTDLMEIEL